MQGTSDAGRQREAELQRVRGDIKQQRVAVHAAQRALQAAEEKAHTLQQQREVRQGRAGGGATGGQQVQAAQPACLLRPLARPPS